MKLRLTADQRRQIRAYQQVGYTFCVIDDKGRVVPGYSDWVLEYILDELDIKSAFDAI